MIDRVMQDALSKAAQEIHFKPGDYYGDGSVVQTDQYGHAAKDAQGNVLTDIGLLYCGRCHKPKQIRLFSSVMGIKEPYCLCDCEQTKEDREREDIIRRSREIDVRHNLSQADSLMLSNTFNADKYPDSQLSKLAHDFVRRWREFYRANGVGLYIYGGVGVGKTFYASCIANEIAKVYGGTVKALSITMVLNELFSTEEKAQYITRLVNHDLLIIDDLGTERRTGYTTEQVFSIIDERYKTKKPLIITSNVPYSALSQNERIDSRIIEMCLPVAAGNETKRNSGTRTGG